MRLETWCREQERAAVGELSARLDQDAQHCRIYEFHPAQVDDEPIGLFSGHGEQSGTDIRRVVEVEFTAEMDDHGAVSPLDPADGVLVESLRIRHDAGKHSCGGPQTAARQQLAFL